ncbi:MAG: UDP-N-acetylglucosamine 2-epimerase (non-hydrolyzing) [Christensenella sp.]
MNKIKVMSVFGTRPEAIKMCPLVKVLQKTEGIESIVCVTAQHRQMLDQVLTVFNIKPDYDLDLMKAGQTLSTITAGVIEGIGNVIDECHPDIVLVHGDTTTSFAAALGAFYKQVKVGHVEAGLRTYNKYSPFPEEMNRVLTSRIADIHFAPTQRNADALVKEGIDKNIFVTGNTVIDAFATTVRKGYVYKNSALKTLNYSGRMILLTAHRRENLGEPLENICNAVLELCRRHKDVHFVYPVHLNPQVQNTVNKMLSNNSQISLIEPIDVEDMHNLMAECYMVMTDSGGLQEEAPHLGKPVVVLRTETERPEAVVAGTAIVVGVATNDIIFAADSLLTDASVYDKMAKAQNPYGDGHASKKIAKAILEM